MASAGTVTLQLDADSVKLLRELQKSQKATQRTASKMRKSMSNAFGSIRKVILSAGSAMAAFAAFRGFSRIATEIDQLGKTVDRLGGSTEAFSELRFVAERSGLAFNTMTMGLQRMQRRVAEAASGFGEAKDALAELGIDVQRLNRLSIDKQFEVLAEALSRVKVEGDRTRLAMKLFDSEGVALLQAMRNGAEGIRELRNEAKELGLSLSGEQVQAMTDAKDAMTNLNASTDALSQTLALKLAPSLAKVLDGWNNMLTSNRQAEIANRMDEIREQLKTLSRFSGESAKKTVRALTDEFGALAQELELLRNPVREFVDGMDEVDEVIGESAVGMTEYNTELAVIAKRFQTAQMKADALRAAIAKFGDDLDPDTLKKMQAEITNILQGGIEEINTGPILRMKKVTKQATDEMTEYSKQAARNMQDAFADFLFDPFEDGLKGMLKSFLDVIRRMLANQLAASIFTNTGFGSLFGGVRAMGGPVTAGTPYLVGERGPELFVPGQSGNVVANNKMGGANITYNIDARGADEASVISRMVPLLERTVQITKDEVRRDINEGRF